MKRAALWLVFGLLGFVAAGCSDPIGVDDVLGIWNTTSINGYSVPGSVVYQGVTHEALYARWAFYDDGLCTLTQHVDGETETFDECQYAVDLELETISVILSYETWEGGLDGSSMTVIDPQDIEWLLVRR